MPKDKAFATEADLVAKFCELVAKQDRRREETSPWTAYHETAGWDLLLSRSDGVQIGIEAKLTLNAKVLDQALPGLYADSWGPDYRAVLVPSDGLQLHLENICRHLGIVVICVEWYGDYRGRQFRFLPRLPSLEEFSYDLRHWPNWLPAQRHKLPDYVPDITGGHAAPVQLTPWKISAIKLMILLERKGAVTRADMKALQLSPSRWTDRYHGFLMASPAGYVRHTGTPDLKKQHPKNWAEIEADFDKWGKDLMAGGPISLPGVDGSLL